MLDDARGAATYITVVRITPQTLAVIVSAIAAAALVVRIAPGAGNATRELLALQFSTAPPDASQGLDILRANARVVALPLLGTLVARSPFGRATFDALLAVVVGLNATLLGAALGAYGQRLLPWLPHAPLELLSIAHATAIYVAARDARLDAAAFISGVLSITGALLAAAALETYVAPL